MSSDAAIQDQNCIICNGRPVQPRLLQCGHICCQRCIDKSLLFNDDGSASMKCPIDACILRTTLTSCETSNDLPSVDISTDTLEHDSSSMAPKCRYKDGCAMAVTLYCCGLKMCNACSQQHVKSEGEHKKVTLYFCPADKELKGFCDSHSTPYSHVCSCDNTLLCVYCVHRNIDHMDHVKNTIQHESAKIRQALLEDYKRRQRMEECRRATEAQIPVSRAKLQELLKKRKEECLAQYAAHLNAEEAKIKDKFQDICGHVQRIAELSLEANSN